MTTDITKLDAFEYFIFDVWGVVHDGSKLYPNVISTLSKLRLAGKKICFLSNAPRRASKVESVLAGFGISKNLYDFVLTSGEASFLSLLLNQKNNFKNYGKKYFYIGPKKDIDVLQGLDYQASSDASNSDFVIVTGFDDNDIADKMAQILEAKKHNLPLICVNPDLLVVDQNGYEAMCAGVLAKRYEEIGGSVKYYGKPFCAVYEEVHKLFGYPDKAKMIAVGDGMETDIKGANDFGVSSVLITSGILSNKIKHLSIESQKKYIVEISEKCKIFPDFIASQV